MIADARQAGTPHHRPPHTALGSARALSHLDLSAAAAECPSGTGGTALDLEAAEADVDDAFYNWIVPELGSWFGLEYGFSGATLIARGFHTVWSDTAGCGVAVGPDTIYWPVFHRLCMGWSWSLFFCQDAFRRFRQPVTSRPS